MELLNYTLQDKIGLKLEQNKEFKSQIATLEAAFDELNNKLREKLEQLKRSVNEEKNEKPYD